MKYAIKNRIEKQGTENKHNYDMNEIKKSLKQNEKKSKKRGKEEIKDDFEVKEYLYFELICRLIQKMNVLRVL